MNENTIRVLFVAAIALLAISLILVIISVVSFMKAKKLYADSTKPVIKTESEISNFELLKLYYDYVHASKYLESQQCLSAMRRRCPYAESCTHEVKMCPVCQRFNKYAPK